jgi:hypothetical protein
VNDEKVGKSNVGDLWIYSGLFMKLLPRRTFMNNPGQGPARVKPAASGDNESFCGKMK